MIQGTEFEARRKKSTERTLAIVGDLLQQEPVRRALGDYAQRLTRVAEMARVPDIIDGAALDLPGYYTNDVFSVSSTRTDELLTHGMTSPMPTQVNTVAAQLYRRPIEGPVGASVMDCLSMMSHCPVSLEASLDRWTAGTSGVPELSMGQEQGYATSWILRGRPFVMIRGKSQANRVLTLLHELSHVDDAISEPLVYADEFTEEDILLRDELKAYASEYAAGTSQARSMVPGMQAAVRFSSRVENLRRRHNGSRHGEKAFVVSDALKRALAAKGLDYIYRD